jgi:3-phenylpropionate/trans-cinnamate dioxygenase ferredoxin reductase subunit
MPTYTYLIVGGGMTAAAAVAGIREGDHDATIGVIGSESHPPYDRPPLSKALWKGDPLDSIWRKVDGSGVTSHMGRTARSLDPGNRQVLDDQGTSYTYGKLLLATGCSPRRLPFGGEQIIHFRTVDDYERLRGMTDQGKRFAVIGGGFIGSELAASLAGNGKQVVMIFPDAGIGSRMYPADLAAYLTSLYREKGVEVLAGATATGYESRDGKPSLLRVQTDHGGSERTVSVDGVVAGIGAEPNVDLARAAGLTVDDGIRVDSSLCTSDPRIYAAGDVASYHDPSLNHDGRVCWCRHDRPAGFVRPPAVLLFRLFRFGVRGRRRGGLAPADGRRLEGTVSGRRDLLPPRRSRTWRATLEHLGPGGCRPPAAWLSGHSPRPGSQTSLACAIVCVSHFACDCFNDAFCNHADRAADEYARSSHNIASLDETRDDDPGYAGRHPSRDFHGQECLNTAHHFVGRPDARLARTEPPQREDSRFPTRRSVVALIW